MGELAALSETRDSQIGRLYIERARDERMNAYSGRSGSRSVIADNPFRKGAAELPEVSRGHSTGKTGRAELQEELKL